MTDSAKRVILGVSGSVAAYKAADLASRLVKSGVDVYPILTRNASRFVSPETFRALTHHPCPIDTFEEPYSGEIAHIYLARLCDVFCIVPASMNTIAKLANGIADDMLTNSAMATPAPILLAPGMNTAMWNHPATQANLTKLKDYGAFFIEPTSGRLACRTEGVGRMADVDTIFTAIQDLLTHRKSWDGVRVLITAGPTREAIDPVRYVSNHSSGRMGYAIAEAARVRGASVTIVSGPVSLQKPGGVEVIDVHTASEMRDTVLARAAAFDVIIASAAVADYRPALVSDIKIKKTRNQNVTLLLERTDDILSLLGGRKKAHQTLVGFAAETNDILTQARAKLLAKNLDWIVANDITQTGAGFDGNTNIVTILGKSGETIPLPLMSKRQVADELLDRIVPPPRRQATPPLP